MLENTRMPVVLIARVAGLSGTILNQFTTNLDEIAYEIENLYQSLHSLELRIADSLFGVIAQASPAERDRLILIRRDFYNGRKKNRQKVLKDFEFPEEIKKCIESAIVIGEKIELLILEYNRKYVFEQDEQERRLFGFAAQREFMHGVAAASITTFHQFRRISNLSSSSRKIVRHLAHTLIRYLTRSAAKVSPFSTLTLAAAVIVKDEIAPLQIYARSAAINGFLRVRRDKLTQISDMLFQIPEFREQLSVMLNSSLIFDTSCHVQFRQSECYVLDKDQQMLAYRWEGIVGLSVSDALAQLVNNLYDLKTVPYCDFIQAIKKLTYEDEQQAIYFFEDLLKLGIIHLQSPWRCDSFELEREIFNCLKKINIENIDLLVNQMDVLLREATHFAAANVDPSHLDNANKALDEVFEILFSLLGLHSFIQGKNKKIRNNSFYHDVWCDAKDTGKGALLSWNVREAHCLLDLMRPLVTYSQIFDLKLDFLFNMGALLCSCYGELCDISLFDAFGASKQLWEGYFSKRTLDPRTLNGFVWKELEFGLLKDLSEMRSNIHSGLDSCFVRNGEITQLDCKRISQLVYSVSRSLLEFYDNGCFFLQPCKTQTSDWVLNGACEGTGRGGSRYTGLMPKRLKESYTSLLKSHSRFFSVDGEEIFLLDVTYKRGDTLNIHLPQTEKVLALPGEHLSVDPERIVNLRDLRVVLDSKGRPQLRGRFGIRYFPVHLGMASLRYAPKLIKFLCALGPSELTFRIPKPSESSELISPGNRIQIGSVVVRRKEWDFSMTELDPLIRCKTDQDAMRYLSSWRNRIGLPKQVFLSEIRTSFDKFLSKPQYLDLTSPLFLPLLRAYIKKNTRLKFIEVLPGPNNNLYDEEYQHWALEILLDGLALHPYDFVRPK
jgi:hypothetical protein